MVTLLETHRDTFGEIADINYDQVFADLSTNVDLSFRLPDSQFSHLYKPVRSMKIVELASMVEVDEMPLKNEGQ